MRLLFCRAAVEPKSFDNTAASTQYGASPKPPTPYTHPICPMLRLIVGRKLPVEIYSLHGVIAWIVNTEQQQNTKKNRSKRTAAFDLPQPHTIRVINYFFGYCRQFGRPGRIVRKKSFVECGNALALHSSYSFNRHTHTQYAQWTMTIINSLSFKQSIALRTTLISFRSLLRPSKMRERHSRAHNTSHHILMCTHSARIYLWPISDWIVDYWFFSFFWRLKWPKCCGVSDCGAAATITHALIEYVNVINFTML